MIARDLILRYAAWIVFSMGLSACGEQARSLVWVVEVDRSVGDAATIEAAIAEGSCAEENSPVHLQTFGVTATPSVPTALGPGEYAFSALALSSACEVVAEGCVARVLPDDRTEIVVSLTPTVGIIPTPRHAAAIARCGGSVDAAKDTTVPDARPPDVPDPRCDDDTQNGDETGVDCGGICAPCPTICTDSPCVTEGLSAHYAFEYTMTDATGNGNGGRGLDGPPSYVPGLYGSAALLDGNGDAVAVDGARPVLDVFRSGPFTVAGWMQHEDITGEARFLWSFDANGDRDLFYLGQKSSDVLQLRNGTSDGVPSNLEINAPPTTPDAWHHVASTFDGAETWVLYVDGCAFHDAGAMPVVTSLAAGDCFVIGNEQSDSCVPGDPRENWRGLVDEVSVFDRALRPDEVLTAASLGPGAIPSCD